MKHLETGHKNVSVNMPIICMHETPPEELRGFS
jgi:hypothetical protein